MSTTMSRTTVTATATAAKCSSCYYCIDDKGRGFGHINGCSQRATDHQPNTLLHLEEREGRDGQKGVRMTS